MIHVLPNAATARVTGMLGRSDGIPGVAGVGPKRAQQLLQRFGCIDSLLVAMGALDGGAGGAAAGEKEAAKALGVPKKTGVAYPRSG